MNEVILNEEQLRERLKYWKRNLRLQDWIIEVGIVRGKNMPDGKVACVNWTLGKKMASISILDHIDYPDDLMDVRNMENDLVHELLHLHLAPIRDHFSDDSNVYITFEEQAIESIASGLLESRRD